MKSRFLLNTTIVVAAVTTGVLLSIRPWEVYKRESVQATGLNAQAIDLEKKKADLTRERDQLQDPLRKQEAVRQIGWVKIGEQPLK
jgi:hypothetical protein